MAYLRSASRIVSLSLPYSDVQGGAAALTSARERKMLVSLRADILGKYCSTRAGFK